MEKTLQQQYILIKEGKGNKDHFLKSARRVFPEFIAPLTDYNTAVTILKNKSILSEGVGGIATQNPNKPDWFKIFNNSLNEGIGVEDLKPGEIYDYKGHVTRGPKEGNKIIGKLKFNKVDERNPDMFIFTWVEISGDDSGIKVGDRFFTSKEGLSKYLYKKDS